jgi:hypothetical protein
MPRFGQLLPLAREIFAVIYGTENDFLVGIIRKMADIFALMCGFWGCGRGILFGWIFFGPMVGWRLPSSGCLSDVPVVKRRALEPFGYGGVGW